MAGQVKTVGVVGLGTMGAGIAEVLARTGLDVVAVEVDDDGVARGRGHLEHSTGRAVERGKLDEDEPRDAARPDHASPPKLTDLADVDLVVEAVPEQPGPQEPDLHRARRDRAQPMPSWPPTPPSLSVTEIAVQTERPDRVVGLHFFNPAPVMKLVEVVRTVVTEPEVIERRRRRSRETLGKTPVVIGDRAGFIANALLFGYLNHASRMYEQRYATPRGHRRGDAARLRLPDGSAGAARPDRPGHRLRDPRHDVPPVPRPAARARRRCSSR